MITASSAADVAKRVKEGWNMIRSTVPAIIGGRALMGEKPPASTGSAPVAQ
jgi:hypothetical protein